MARICIISPGHLSTNPRLVKEADALSGAGYDVSVIAANYLNWAREADHIFVDRPWPIIQTIPFGPNAPRRVRALQLFRRHMARLMVTAGIEMPSVVLAAWHPIGPDLVTAALQERADLYIAHYPAALPAAAIAARHYGALYAYDAEDFHLGDFPKLPQHIAERHMLRTIEEYYLRGCAYVTAASPGIADAYVAEYGIEVPTVILNVFPQSHAPLHFTPSGIATPGPSVYWFSQTIGPNRGLECAVRAIGRSHLRPHLYLRGAPANGFIDRLYSLAAEAGVVHHIHILPPAAPSEMECLAASYDLGLSGEPGHTANNKIALGNKLFSYLLAGVPVAMSDIPAHRAFAGEVATAVRLYSIDDADSLASALDLFLCNPASLAAARAEAFRFGQTRFNWEKERLVLLNRVESTLRANFQQTPSQVAGAATQAHAL